MTTEKEPRSRKEITIPGEIITEDENVLPGDWTMKEGNKIIATRLGIVDQSDRLVKIIPLTGVYIPRRGNVVVGEIKDITFSGWLVEIGGPYSAFLSLKEVPGFIEESEMETIFGIGDLVVMKILNVKRTSVDLTMKQREKGLGKIKDGLILKINPHRVPRVIGKEGSMISMIKEASGCIITVGQNGIIWIKGSSIERELYAKKAIEYIVENTVLEGLTEKVEKWIEKSKPAKEIRTEENMEGEE